MKLISAVVMTLALAMGVQSSIIPLGWPHTEIAGHGLSYTAVSGPAHLPLLAAHAPAAIALHTSPAIHGGWPGLVVDAPHIHAPHIHAPVLLGHAHEGQYVAKTRGALHTAPLAGHIASAAAINVAPAPGTI